MPQGTGKTSPSRRRSSDGHPFDDRPRLTVPATQPSPGSAPSSFFDASIPLNLPPRRSMKMLKDGSDFVWPDAAHSLFVRGLQAWKFLNLGSKRTRAPRGEGKTDFLVRYLENHGVRRTKKQVASHLQVLRTEWRNSDNLLLLSLVDDTLSHTRSLSEPSLPFPQPPPPSSTKSSPSSSMSVFSFAPDPSHNRAVSAPSPPYTAPIISPLPSLLHPAHQTYDAHEHSQMEPIPDNHLSRYHSIGSWSLEDAAPHTAVDRLPRSSRQEPESFIRDSLHYSIATYDPPPSFNDYDRTFGPALTQPPFELPGIHTEYYNVPDFSAGRDNLSSLSHRPPRLPQQENLQPSRVNFIPNSPYDSYNPSPYHSIAQPDAFGHAGTSYGIEPYQPHLSSALPANLALPAHTVASEDRSTIAGSALYNAVEPDLLHSNAQQPQWIRPPATFPRQPSTPESHDRSPEL